MKIDRLIGILSVLLRQEVTTAPKLAEIFEVSRRTINRDIEDLCRAGIPIQTIQGTGGGIRIMEGYAMDRTLLTSKDMQMIMAGQCKRQSVLWAAYGKNKARFLRPDQREGFYIDRSVLMVQRSHRAEAVSYPDCH